jgi:hypothetical protein
MIEGKDYRIVKKEDSRLMRVIEKLLFFNPMFMREYITTIGTTIYAPGGEIDPKVLAHELVHVADYKRWGILFSLSYLLFPLPAVFTMRAYWEKRGYAETIRQWYALNPNYPKTPQFRDWIISQFTSSMYLFMCPFRKHMERWYDSQIAELDAKNKNV